MVNVAIDASDPDPSAEIEFDVVVDASTPEGTVRASEIALNKGVPLLVCTTGLPEATLEIVHEASAEIPVLLAPNTSPGVAVVSRLVQEAAKLLDGWTVQIDETHHVKKKDKPSGTARLLAELVESARGEQVSSESVKSHRHGNVVGEHTVTFTGQDEIIRIEHKAFDRVLFGHGAILAARWLLRQPAGRYTIQQTLG